MTSRGSVRFSLDGVDVGGDQRSTTGVASRRGSDHAGGHGTATAERPPQHDTSAHRSHETQQRSGRSSRQSRWIADRPGTRGSDISLPHGQHDHFDGGEQHGGNGGHSTNVGASEEYPDGLGERVVDGTQYHMPDADSAADRARAERESSTPDDDDERLPTAPEDKGRWSPALSSLPGREGSSPATSVATHGNGIHEGQRRRKSRLTFDTSASESGKYDSLFDVDSVAPGDLKEDGTRSATLSASPTVSKMSHGMDASAVARTFGVSGFGKLRGVASTAARWIAGGSRAPAPEDGTDGNGLQLPVPSTPPWESERRRRRDAGSNDTSLISEREATRKYRAGTKGLLSEEEVADEVIRDLARTEAEIEQDAQLSHSMSMHSRGSRKPVPVSEGRAYLEMQKARRNSALEAEALAAAKAAGMVTLRVPSSLDDRSGSPAAQSRGLTTRGSDGGEIHDVSTGEKVVAAFATVEPSCSSTAGGTALRITSRTRREESAAEYLRVRFRGADGEAVVASAKFVSPFEVSCVAPPWAKPGSCTVMISDNGGVTFEGDALPFHYYDQPAAALIEPHAGPACGGYSVSIMLGVGRFVGDSEAARIRDAWQEAVDGLGSAPTVHVDNRATGEVFNAAATLRPLRTRPTPRQKRRPKTRGLPSSSASEADWGSYSYGDDTAADETDASRSRATSALRGVTPAVFPSAAATRPTSKSGVRTEGSVREFAGSDFDAVLEKTITPDHPEESEVWRRQQRRWRRRPTATWEGSGSESSSDSDFDDEQRGSWAIGLRVEFVMPAVPQGTYVLRVSFSGKDPTETNSVVQPLAGSSTTRSRSVSRAASAIHSWFRVYQTPTITKCQPACGPIALKRPITIHGKHFDTSVKHAVVRFMHDGTEGPAEIDTAGRGDARTGHTNVTIDVPAVVLSSRRLRCCPPVGLPEGPVKVSVSFNHGAVTTREQLDFQLYKPPTIKSVSPEVGTCDGGYPVYLEAALDYRTAFEGGTSIPLGKSYIRDSGEIRVRLVIPKKHVGELDSYDGARYTSVEFERLFAEAMRPRSEDDGSSEGEEEAEWRKTGKQATYSSAIGFSAGDALSPSDDLAAGDGHDEASGVIVIGMATGKLEDDGRISFVAPNSAGLDIFQYVASETVEVQVALDGVTFVDGVNFVMCRPPEIERLSLRAGPAMGATTMKIKLRRGVIDTGKLAVKFTNNLIDTEWADLVPMHDNFGESGIERSDETIEDAQLFERYSLAEDSDEEFPQADDSDAPAAARSSAESARYLSQAYEILASTVAQSRAAHLLQSRAATTYRQWRKRSKQWRPTRAEKLSVGVRRPPKRTVVVAAKPSRFVDEQIVELECVTPQWYLPQRERGFNPKGAWGAAMRAQAGTIGALGNLAVGAVRDVKTAAAGSQRDRRGTKDGDSSDDDDPYWAQDSFRTRLEVSINGVSYSETTDARSEFVFYKLPRVTRVQPASGDIAGGTPVRIWAKRLFIVGQQMALTRRRQAFAEGAMAVHQREIEMWSAKQERLSVRPSAGASGRKRGAYAKLMQEFKAALAALETRESAGDEDLADKYAFLGMAQRRSAIETEGLRRIEEWKHEKRQRSAEFFDGKLSKQAACELGVVMVAFADQRDVEVVPGRPNISGYISCVAPAFRSPIASVELSVNGDHFTGAWNPAGYVDKISETSRFAYFERPQPTFSRPEVAMMKGGTCLTIYGTGFPVVPSADIRVRFTPDLASVRDPERDDDAAEAEEELSEDEKRRREERLAELRKELRVQTVRAELRGDTVMCLTPDVAAPHKSAVDIAFNGLQFRGSALQVEFFARPKLKALEPPIGVASEDNDLRLTLPRMPRRALSSMRVMFVHSSKRWPALDDRSLITSMKTPWSTVVTCRSNPSRLHDSVIATLPCPSVVDMQELFGLVVASHVRNCRLRLSYDGQHFFTLGNLHDYFRAFLWPRVSVCHPPCGPVSGGTYVLLRGNGFVDSGNVWVRFYCRKTGLSTFAEATYISAHAVLCKSPPWPAKTGPHSTVVHVSLYGRRFPPAGTHELGRDGTQSMDGSPLFTFETVPSITALAPKAGCVRGDTRVVLEAERLPRQVTFYVRFRKLRRPTGRHETGAALEPLRVPEDASGEAPGTGKAREATPGTGKVGSQGTASARGRETSPRNRSTRSRSSRRSVGTPELCKGTTPRTPRRSPSRSRSPRLRPGDSDARVKALTKEEKRKARMVDRERRRREKNERMAKGQQRQQAGAAAADPAEPQPASDPELERIRSIIRGQLIEMRAPTDESVANAVVRARELMNGALSSADKYVTVHANRIDARSASCLSPPSEIVGTSRVEVSVDGQQFVECGVFHYYSAPSVSFMAPRYGPQAGGTKVLLRCDPSQYLATTRLTVAGHPAARPPHAGFPVTGVCMVRFGEREDSPVAQAELLDENTIEVVTPPQPRAGVVHLYVSFDGQHYESFDPNSRSRREAAAVKMPAAAAPVSPAATAAADSPKAAQGGSLITPRRRRSAAGRRGSMAEGAVGRLAVSPRARRRPRERRRSAAGPGAVARDEATDWIFTTSLDTDVGRPRLYVYDTPRLEIQGTFSGSEGGGTRVKGIGYNLMPRMSDGRVFLVRFGDSEAAPQAVATIRNAFSQVQKFEVLSPPLFEQNEQQRQATEDKLWTEFALDIAGPRVVKRKPDTVPPPMPYPPSRLWASVDNGVTYVPTEAEFVYFRNFFVINEVVPMSGPRDGGTKLVISGSEMAETSEIVVRFGRRVRVHRDDWPTFVERRRARQTTSATAMKLLAGFSVDEDDEDRFTSDEEEEEDDSHDPHQRRRQEWKWAWEFPPVTVKGYAEMGNIICETPRCEAMFVTGEHAVGSSLELGITVSPNNGIDWAHGIIRFTYYTPPAIISVTPPCIERRSTHPITVMAPGIVITPDPTLIRFKQGDRAYEVAAQHSGVQLLAHVPVISDLEECQLAVSLNGQQYAAPQLTDPAGYPSWSSSREDLQTQEMPAPIGDEFWLDALGKGAKAVYHMCDPCRGVPTTFRLFEPPLFAVTNAGPSHGGSRMTLRGGRTLVIALGEAMLRVNPRLKKTLKHMIRRRKRAIAVGSLPADDRDWNVYIEILRKFQQHAEILVNFREVEWRTLGIAFDVARYFVDTNDESEIPVPSHRLAGRARARGRGRGRGRPWARTRSDPRRPPSLGRGHTAPPRFSGSRAGRYRGGSVATATTADSGSQKAPTSREATPDTVGVAPPVRAKGKSVPVRLLWSEKQQLLDIDCITPSMRKGAQVRAIQLVVRPAATDGRPRDPHEPDCIIDTAEHFVFYNQPVITSLHPPSGPFGAATDIVIRGKRFVDTDKIVVRFRYKQQRPLPTHEELEREAAPDNEELHGTVAAPQWGKWVWVAKRTPGTFTRNLPDGTRENSGVILCKLPALERHARVSLNDARTEIVERGPKDREELDMLCGATPKECLTVLVDVSLNEGLDFNPLPSAYICFVPPEVTHVEPKLGVRSASSPCKLTIHGAHFAQTRGVLVRFSGFDIRSGEHDAEPADAEPTFSTTVKGEVIKSTKMVCTVPPLPSAGVYRVEVTLNGQTFTSSHCTFVAYDEPSVVRISPCCVALGGNKEVRVDLVDCALTPKVFVRFAADTGRFNKNADVEVVGQDLTGDGAGGFGAGPNLMKKATKLTIRDRFRAGAFAVGMLTQLGHGMAKPAPVDGDSDEEESLAGSIGASSGGMGRGPVPPSPISTASRRNRRASSRVSQLKGQLGGGSLYTRGKFGGPLTRSGSAKSVASTRKAAKPIVVDATIDTVQLTDVEGRAHCTHGMNEEAILTAALGGDMNVANGEEPGEVVSSQQIAAEFTLHATRAAYANPGAAKPSPPDGGEGIGVEGTEPASNPSTSTDPGPAEDAGEVSFAVSSLLTGTMGTNVTSSSDAAVGIAAQFVGGASENKGTEDAPEAVEVEAEVAESSSTDNTTDVPDRGGDADPEWLVKRWVALLNREAQRRVAALEERIAELPIGVRGPGSERSKLIKEVASTREAAALVSNTLLARARVRSITVRAPAATSLGFYTLELSLNGQQWSAARDQKAPNGPDTPIVQEGVALCTKPTPRTAESVVSSWDTPVPPSGLKTVTSLQHMSADHALQEGRVRASRSALRHQQLRVVGEESTLSGADGGMSTTGPAKGPVLKLRYYDPSLWRIDSVTPTCALLDGGTEITLLGRHFVETGSVLVRFGDAPPVPASVEGGAIRCASPRVADPSFVNVTVSPDGEYWTDPREEATFRFYEAPSDLVLLTSLVPAASESTLTIAGGEASAFDSGSIKVRLEPVRPASRGSDASTVAMTVIVDGKFVAGPPERKYPKWNPDMHHCHIIATVPASLRARTIAVAVSLDGGALFVPVLPDVEVFSISDVTPEFGLLAGGTQVRLRGSALKDEHASAADVAEADLNAPVIRFTFSSNSDDSTVEPEIVDVTGCFIGSDVSCRVPACPKKFLVFGSGGALEEPTTPDGAVSAIDDEDEYAKQHIRGQSVDAQVEVSLDRGRSFTSASGTKFSYVADCEVLTVQPKSGPISGGTTVSLTGINFVDVPGIVVRFTDGEKGLAVDTPATFVSSTQLTCVAPEWPTKTGAATAVLVSLNGQQFSGDQLPEALSFVDGSADGIVALQDDNVDLSRLGTEAEVAVRGQVATRRHVTAADAPRTDPSAPNWVPPAVFVFTPPPMVSVVTPHCGILGEKTVITLRGAHLSSAGDAMLKFVGPKESYTVEAQCWAKFIPTDPDAPAALHGGVLSSQAPLSRESRKEEPADAGRVRCDLALGLDAYQRIRNSLLKARRDAQMQQQASAWRSAASVLRSRAKAAAQGRRGRRKSLSTATDMLLQGAAAAAAARLAEGEAPPSDGNARRSNPFTSLCNLLHDAANNRSHAAFLECYSPVHIPGGVVCGLELSLNGVTYFPLQRRCRFEFLFMPEVTHMNISASNQRGGDTVVLRGKNIVDTGEVCVWLEKIGPLVDEQTEHEFTAEQRRVIDSAGGELATGAAALAAREEAIKKRGDREGALSNALWHVESHAPGSSSALAGDDDDGSPRARRGVRNISKGRRLFTTQLKRSRAIGIVKKGAKVPQRPPSPIRVDGGSSAWTRLRGLRRTTTAPPERMTAQECRSELVSNAKRFARVTSDNEGFKIRCSIVDDAAHFVLPAIPEVGKYAVLLSLNGVDYWHEYQTIIIHRTPWLNSLSVQCVDSAGGSRLEIRGAEFADSKDITVRFEYVKDLDSPRPFGHDEDDEFCEVPLRTAANNALIEQAEAEAKAKADRLLRMTLRKTFSIHVGKSSKPKQHKEPSSGASGAGALRFRSTTVVEAHTRQHTQIRWKADAVETTKGTFVSPSLLWCIVPKLPGPGRALVRVSLNGQDFKTIGRLAVWVFGAPKIRSVVPSDGPFTTVVRVRGSGFVDIGQSCVRFRITERAWEDDIDEFLAQRSPSRRILAKLKDPMALRAPSRPGTAGGSSEWSAEDDAWRPEREETYVMPSRVVSGMLMVCNTPPVPACSRALVSVSLNGVDFSDGRPGGNPRSWRNAADRTKETVGSKELMICNRPVIRAAIPDCGFAAGGTRVMLVGHDFAGVAERAVVKLTFRVSEARRIGFEFTDEIDELNPRPETDTESSLSLSTDSGSASNSEQTSDSYSSDDEQEESKTAMGVRRRRPGQPPLDKRGFPVLEPAAITLEVDGSIEEDGSVVFYTPACPLPRLPPTMKTKQSKLVSAEGSGSEADTAAETAAAYYPRVATKSDADVLTSAQIAAIQSDNKYMELSRVLQRRLRSLAGDAADLFVECDVDVSLHDGRHYTHRPFPFRYVLRQPRASQVQPKAAPLWGGVPIRVLGSGFLNTGIIKVRFIAGDDVAVVDATWISDTCVECIAPAMAAPSNAHVQVSLNEGAEFSPMSHSVQVVFYDQWHRRGKLHLDGPAYRRADATSFDWPDKLPFYGGKPDAVTSQRIVRDNMGKSTAIPSVTHLLPKHLQQIREPSPLLNSWGLAGRDLRIMEWDGPDNGVVPFPESQARLAAAAGGAGGTGGVVRPASSDLHLDTDYESVSSAVVEEPAPELYIDNNATYAEYVRLIQRKYGKESMQPDAAAVERSRMPLLARKLADLMAHPHQGRYAKGRLRNRFFRYAKPPLYDFVTRRGATAALTSLFPEASPVEMDRFWDYVGGNDFGKVNYVLLLDHLTDPRRREPHPDDPGPGAYTPRTDVITDQTTDPRLRLASPAYPFTRPAT